MSSSLTRAAEVRLPEEGEIRVVAVTGTSAATDITEFGGHWITFHAETEDIYVVFGDSGVVADDTATAGDTRAWRIPADQSISCYYPKAHTDKHGGRITSVAAICASSATLRYYKS